MSELKNVTPDAKASTTASQASSATRHSTIPSIRRFDWSSMTNVPSSQNTHFESHRDEIEISGETYVRQPNDIEIWR